MLGNTMEMEEAQSMGGLIRDRNFDVEQVDAFLL